MTDIKSEMFDARDIATVSTGIVLQVPFKGQEVISALVGRDVWTHELANEKLAIESAQAILRQYPDMPTALPPDMSWQQTADWVFSRWPEPIALTVDIALAAQFGGKP